MAAKTGRKQEATDKPARAAAEPVVENRVPDFDRLIHEKTRLGIVSALAVNPSLSFTELKAILETSDGNVSVHARKLEDARYLTCRKTFEGRVPRTEFALTAAGRRALERYLSHMEALIKATRQS